MSDQSGRLPHHEVISPSDHAGQDRALPPDDMIDQDTDHGRWPFLDEVLGDYRDSLLATYLKSDGAALVAQRAHHRHVVLAAISATAAVSIAILHLAWPVHPLATELLEFIFAVLAMLFFHRGAKSREQWLTERHKAERCRFLKFNVMIHSRVWSRGGETSGEDEVNLGKQIAEVRKLSYLDLRTWLENEKVPPPPGRFAPHDFKQLAGFCDYYRKKRLEFQKDFFQRQSERNVKRDEWWRALPSRLFAVSVLLVFGKAVLRGVLIFAHWMAATPSARRILPEASELIFGISAHRWDLFLDVALVCAALLPVFGSGIRTWRSAHESSRNISRFRANYVALTNIEERLQDAKIEDATRAESVLRDIWYAEEIMESEHREWLRLMIESDWLG